MQIDDSSGDLSNAPVSSHEQREGDSNVTIRSDEQWLKQSSPISSQWAGKEKDESDSQPAKTPFRTDES
jgi:hypothetical protein